MKDYKSILSGLESEGRLRSLPYARELNAIDMSSNDYLGLRVDTSLTDEFLQSNRMLPFTSSASRLLLTDQQPYRELESFLASEYGKSILLFNSGYHANTGTVSALAGKDTLIVCDKLVHASIIDGIVLSKSPFARFRHNDMQSLRAILEKEQGKYNQILLIVESIYSMDGDVASLQEIVELKKHYPEVLLYVDEAHAVGVRGSRGLGIAEELGLLADIDVLIGTFGKACASMGAFVATSEVIRDYLLNSARSFIFSTALPPITVSWTHFLFRNIVEMSSHRERLKSLGDYFRNGLKRLTGEENVSSTQIIPWIIGDAKKTVEISNQLKQAGFIALPIRRPTVAAGTERIRFSLNANIKYEEIDALLGAISNII